MMKNELNWKTILRIVGIIAFVAVIGFTMASCVTTTIGGASGDHGLFTGLSGASTLTEGATKIEQYWVILGLFDVGFGDYAAAVKKAEASGKKIVSTSKNFFGVVGVTTAYAK